MREIICIIELGVENAVKCIQIDKSNCNWKYTSYKKHNTGEHFKEIIMRLVLLCS